MNKAWFRKMGKVLGILFTLVFLAQIDSNILALAAPGKTNGSPFKAAVSATEQIQFSAATYSVSEGGGIATITLTRTGNTNGMGSVTYTTSNGTAVSGSDYTATSGTVSFSNNQTTATFTLLITDDNIYEPNETINLTLSNPGNGASLGTQSTATLTITENDPQPVLNFSAATYSASEPSGTFTVNVTLTGNTAMTTTVNYSTSNGTATQGSDYTATSGTLTFAPGVTSSSFAVGLLDDGAYEGNETFNLTLSEPVNANLGTTSTSMFTIIDDEKCLLNFGSATYTAAESAGTASVTVNRIGDLTGTITVNYSSSGGTATQGEDYSLTPGTLTFADGESSKAIPITLLEDVYFEGNETFTLSLSSPGTGGVLGTTTTTTVTITDNDTLPPIQFGQPTYSSAEDGGNAIITVTRSGDLRYSSTVNYTSSNGTAIAGSDYTAISGTLTFATNETSKTLSIPITNDGLLEGNETVNLALSALGNATLGTQSTAILTIIDDEKCLLTLSSTTYTVQEDGNNAIITVSRIGDLSGTMTVNYSTAGGTATAGMDYITTTGTLTLGDGENSKIITVPILEDIYYEGNETVNITLSAPGTGGALGTPITATVTIGDNDTPPSIQFGASAYSVGEADGVVQVTVYRSGDDTFTSEINYTIGGGTATAGTDYIATIGMLTFAPGVNTATFTVNILDDAIFEGTETLNLTLSNPANALLGIPSTAVLNITDDERSTVKLVAASFSVGEEGGAVSVTVNRTGDLSGTVTVDYATGNGTATAGTDYEAASGTLTFADGESSKVITVNILDDTIFEANEAFTITLTSPKLGAALGTPASGTISIVENDTPPAVEFSQAQFAASEGAETAVITVTRAGDLGVISQVNYQVTSDMAVAGTDFVATSGTVTFGVGEASKTFAVTLLNDANYEGDETANLTLGSPVVAVLGSQSTAKLKIIDDEVALIRFQQSTATVGEGNSIGIVIERIGDLSGSSTVDYQVTGGTASVGDDFESFSGTLNFEVGQAVAVIDLATIEDSLLEGAETIDLAISNPTGGVISGTGALTATVITIADNDMPEGDITKLEINSIGSILALPVGSTKTVVVYAVMADGQKFDITAASTWTSTNTNVVSVTPGLLTARSAGSAVVKITFGSFVKQFSVSVR